MFNQAGAEIGLDTCSEKTERPIVQDDVAATTWKGLGCDYNSALVVSPTGVVQEYLEPLVFPGSDVEIEAAVNAVLP